MRTAPKAILDSEGQPDIGRTIECGSIWRRRTQHHTSSSAIAGLKTLAQWEGYAGALTFEMNSH